MKEALTAIHKIQHLFSFSDQDMAQLFDISELKYKNIVSNPKLISLGEIKYFASSLELDHDNILDGIVDYDQLSKRWIEGETKVIPKRYQSYPGSKIRTIENILNPLRDYFGEHWVQKVLWHFQLHSDLLSDENQFVNVLLIRDMLEYLKRELKVSENDFHCFGLISHRSPKSNMLRDYVKSITNPKDLYEKIFTEFTPYYEKNFNYQILNLSSESMDLECIEKPDLASSLNVKMISHLESNAYREGVIRSMPELIGLSMANIEKLKCVHQGDPKTVYRVKFNEHKSLMLH